MQRVTLHRRAGTATAFCGPGSASHHFVLRCARDTRPLVLVFSVNSEAQRASEDRNTRNRNPAAFPPFAAEFSAISPYAASVQGSFA
jgi:hypothetical protein